MSAALTEALAETAALLVPQTHLDWSVNAGPLEWSCRQTAAHLAHDLLAYAGQVASGAPDGYLPFDLTVHPEATPAETLAVVAAAGRLLSTAAAAAAPTDRAWHFGPCDPPGFAAMGTAETLLHTHDIAQGLGLPWQPPPHLARTVLDRLFPEAPPGDPTSVLLWSTGRGDLPGHDRLTSWVWKAAVG
ncbi:maleylpyruvate isomerase N-terminal domain-containing protein [Kitasatospora sp. NPDC002227]|uniref:maleylpyruvate isomerase N-terminal domain-containing protein n=1 Tax=Kitasatospora sp. NPDC002227 TaxID=3154773 RepID=UPI003319CC1B